MQDFYILQRSQDILNADQIQRWLLTVEIIGPDGIIMGDDETNSFMLASQGEDYLYMIPLVRHLNEDEAERIVEGYMRIAEHDFEIETSNVYRRQAHNQWIQTKTNEGWRYGLNMSPGQKTHPAMRPWDDLPESYRRLPETTDKELLDFYSQNINKFT